MRTMNNIITYEKTMRIRRDHQIQDILNIIKSNEQNEKNDNLYAIMGGSCKWARSEITILWTITNNLRKQQSINIFLNTRMNNQKNHENYKKFVTGETFVFDAGNPLWHLSDFDNDHTTDSLQIISNHKRKMRLNLKKIKIL